VSKILTPKGWRDLHIDEDRYAFPKSRPGVKDFKKGTTKTGPTGAPVAPKPGSPSAGRFAPQGDHKGGKIETVRDKGQAQSLAKKFKAQGHKVSINKRKDGFKVYIYNK